jgi:hypothetical protein
MIRRVVLGTVLVAMLALVAGSAVAGAKRTPDLAGRWHLESQDVTVRPPLMDGPSGDGPPGGGGGFGGGPPGGGGGFGGGPPGGGGGFGGGPPGGGGGGRGKRGGPPGGGPGAGVPGEMAPPATLPDDIVVTQSADWVSFATPQGDVDQRIALGRSGPDAGASPVLAGRWKGKKLVASGDREGMSVRQTITLAQKGAVMIVRTKIESSGDRPGFDVKRSYRRGETR